MFELAPLILGIFLAQASPGPNMIAVSSISLGSGRQAGVLTAAGVATGVFVWAVLFAFGVGAFLNAFPQTLIAMKLLGGGYLLYLGMKALRSAWRRDGAASNGARSSVGKLCAYRTGLLVVLTNPKAAMMWVAVSMFLAAAEFSNGQFLIVGVCVSLSALGIYGAYAFAFSTGAAVRAYGRFFRVIETTFGALFGAIGARLVADGIRELRN